MNLKTDLTIRSIKLLDISLCGIYYYFASLLISLFIKNNFPKYEKEKYKKIKSTKLVAELMLRVAVIMISLYLLRQLVQNIPFILDGYMGYDHFRIKELNGAVIIAFSLLILQSDFKAKTEVLGERIQNSLFES